MTVLPIKDVAKKPRGVVEDVGHELTGMTEKAATAPEPSHPSIKRPAIA